MTASVHQLIQIGKMRQAYSSQLRSKHIHDSVRPSETVKQ